MSWCVDTNQATLQKNQMFPSVNVVFFVNVVLPAQVGTCMSNMLKGKHQLPIIWWRFPPCWIPIWLVCRGHIQRAPFVAIWLDCCSWVLGKRCCRSWPVLLSSFLFFGKVLFAMVPERLCHMGNGILVCASAKGCWIFPENHPLCIAMAKAPSNQCLLAVAKALRNRLLPIPTDCPQVCHCFYTQGWSTCVPLVTAPWQAMAASLRSARSWSHLAVEQCENFEVSVGWWERGVELLGLCLTGHCPVIESLQQYFPSPETTDCSPWSCFQSFVLHGLEPLPVAMLPGWGYPLIPRS